MNALIGRHVLPPPFLYWQSDQGQETMRGKRRFRLLLKVASIILIVLLLIGVVWVVPVVSRLHL
jgi:cytoskeletal protein RodZ